MPFGASFQRAQFLAPRCQVLHDELQITIDILNTKSYNLAEILKLRERTDVNVLHQAPIERKG